VDEDVRRAVDDDELHRQAAAQLRVRDSTHPSTRAAGRYEIVTVSLCPLPTDVSLAPVTTTPPEYGSDAMAKPWSVPCARPSNRRAQILWPVSWSYAIVTMSVEFPIELVSAVVVPTTYTRWSTGSTTSPRGVSRPEAGPSYGVGPHRVAGRRGRGSGGERDRHDGEERGEEAAGDHLA
jgi:hypothetical protein